MSSTFGNQSEKRETRREGWVEITSAEQHRNVVRLLALASDKREIHCHGLDQQFLKS